MFLYCKKVNFVIDDKNSFYFMKIKKEFIFLVLFLIKRNDIICKGFFSFNEGIKNKKC